MPDLIGKSLGPYRILEQIGVGGMATVYRAYQPGMDRDVALKILPVHFARGEEFAIRFQREAQAIARLEHPHILPVYDYGEYDDITYLAMRYVRAGTLRDCLGRGRLPLEEINRLIGQIAGALDHAHRQGVIHRDVKPSNVLVDEQGNTYLTDFGLARMLETSQQLTASGVGLGTPAYMSPEQGQGLKVDHRSDIYSLGVILYEMVTGHVPFEAETPMGVVLKHITEALPLPRAVQPGVPEAVERVILKALAKDPAHRYVSAGELAQALERAVRQAQAEAPTIAAVGAPTASDMPARATPLAAAEEPTCGAAPPAPTERRVQLPRARQIVLAGGGLLAVAALVFGVVWLAPQLAAPVAAPTATAAGQATMVSTTTARPPATAAVVATAPPAAASPLPDRFTLTLRLRFSSTSDWADLVLLSSGKIVEARTLEFSPDVTLAAMDIERRTIDLDQLMEAAEAGKQATLVLDLVLAGVPADGEVRFKTDKGCLGVLKIEVFNLSVGEPVPVKDFAVEGCNPPNPQFLAVPVARLTEVLTAGPPPEAAQLIVNWCDERWPGELCLHDLRANRMWDITTDQAELFKGDRGAVSWSPDGQRLVYSAAREADQPQKLTWIFSDGGGGGQITGGDSYDHDAVWSPDGEWIAFVRDSDLWLVRPDGSEVRPLLESSDYDVRAPAWSPDGRQIAYLSHADGLVTGIWVVSAEGGQPHQVNDCGQACGTGGAVAWTPDGRKLLYWHFEKNIEQRLLVFADGGGLAGKIEGVPYWWQPNFWTPRAGACRVVYARDGDIHMRDCDGQNGRGLTEGPALDWRPAWSPDGQQVVFQSNRDRQPTAEGKIPESLYVMDADGSNLSRLTSGDDNDLTAAWSPDGSWIAFHRSCHLAMVRPDGRGLFTMVDFAQVSTRPGRQLCAMVPAWSPDSRQITFVAMPPGDDVPGPYERDIYVVNADGTGLRRLASFSTAVYAGWMGVDVVWSPDGSAVAFQFDDAGQVRHYRISVDGSRDPEEIAPFPEAWHPWRWPQWDGQAPAAATSITCQARAFVQPIWAAIADRPPDFEDDFSAAGRGWGIGGEPQEGSAVQDGVLRLRVNEGSATTGNPALNRKDFVLEMQARVAEGDKATQLSVLIHTVSSEYWFRVEVISAGNSWLVDKNVPGQRPNLANGTGYVSPFGEPTHILIVARGPRAAVYLNWMPVAYFDDPDFDTSGGAGLFCQSPGQAVCEFDNVKFWNLANVPGLP